MSYMKRHFEEITNGAQYQGKLWERYQIYVSCALPGEYIKTFDEWLNG